MTTTTRRLMARRRATTMLVLLATASAACAGPRDPLAVGVREVASDILLGGGGAEPPPLPIVPLPPTTVSIAIPIALPPPRPRPRPTGAPTPSQTTAPVPLPSATPDTCPLADPLSTPRTEAPQDGAIIPPLATFPYRNNGEFEVGGANAQIGIFSGDTERTVVAVDETDQGFDYAVEAELGGTITRSVYRVINTGPVEGPLTQVGRDDDLGRGLFLIQVVSDDGENTPTQFNPQPPISLLPFPAIAATTFTAAGTDLLTGTTMSFDGLIVGKQRVDACGEFIDAIRVEVTNGRLVGPNTDIGFSAIYDHATQYGGITVHDVFQIAGTESGIPVTRTNEATINVVPDAVAETLSDAG